MSPELRALAVTHADVVAAAGRLEGVAVRTPLLESAALNAATGARVLLKAESLQRTGSFKFRGAYNRLVQLDRDARAAGVVAWSSGNHAQGVAAAAELLGLPAAIVMPEDAPAVKLANTRAYGAETILYDRQTQSRETLGRRLAEARGATLVPSYDDPHVIAGQGTVGLELAEQAGELGATLDAVLVCCGGGGLAAGISTALAVASPATPVYCVEPAGFDDHARTLAAGSVQRNSPEARSICDALLAPEPGRLTLPINSRLLAGGLVVTDAEVRAAMRYAFSVLKLVVEPGGAVALAAALEGRLAMRGRTVGVIISGGNVDPTLFAEVLIPS